MKNNAFLLNFSTARFFKKKKFPEICARKRRFMDICHYVDPRFSNSRKILILGQMSIAKKYSTKFLKMKISDVFQEKNYKCKKNFSK